MTVYCCCCCFIDNVRGVVALNKFRLPITYNVHSNCLCAMRLKILFGRSRPAHSRLLPNLFCSMRDSFAHSVCLIRLRSHSTSQSASTLNCWHSEQQWKSIVIHAHTRKRGRAPLSLCMVRRQKHIVTDIFVNRTCCTFNTISLWIHECLRVCVRALCALYSSTS